MFLILFITQSRNYICLIVYLYIRTRHSYVAYSRPNGWTDGTEFFVDTHGWPWGVLG